VSIVHALAWRGNARGVSISVIGIVLLGVAVVVDLGAVGVVGWIRGHTEIGGTAALAVYFALVGGTWLLVSRRLPGGDAGWRALLPGALVIVGKTREEAQQKKALLDSLVHPDSGVPNLSIRLGVNASGFDLDGPLPEIPQTNQSQSGQNSLIALARRENLTVRQLAQLVGGYGGLQMIGTASEIADTMQEWLETEAADGFNVMFHTVPAGLEEFVEHVVPELQRRGIFRRDYEGTTLRDHLGLPRPANRFFPADADRRPAAE